jgi:transcriptional regulator GlxA family with amidase domain
MQDSDSPIEIGFLLIPGFALMSYASAIEPLRAANHIAGKELYRLRIISVRGDGAICSAGHEVSCSSSIENKHSLDFLFVCAGGNPFAFRHRKVITWLRSLAAEGVILGGISGGPVILAKANVIAGRRVTVHWEHGEAMREAFPKLVIERSLYVIDRDRITCAGGVAPMDMMHAIIAEHHGAPFAKKISDWFLHTAIRPPGAAQRMGIAESYRVSNPAILHAIEFMQNQMGSPPSLREIARYAGVSERQLGRLFKQEVGESAAHFFRKLRLNYASRLLHQSTMSITEIGYAAGFSSGSHFSKRFTEEFGETPIRFRKKRR